MINPVRFVWRTFAKSLVYFLFAAGSLFLITAVFPLICLLAHPAERCRKALRYSVYITFRVMRQFAWILGLTKVTISAADRRYLKNLKSAVVVANHPSLLDITHLISFLPHADCIVNARLFEMPIVKHVVRQLFIPNSLDFTQILDSCGESLANGSCVVIFPEGSRTRPGHSHRLRKGSARIALGTGHSVLPIHIEANGMRGLLKGDPFYRINEKGRYLFSFVLKPPILPDAYAGLPISIAARKMTDEISERIF